jgi:hypothetical protein
MKKVIITFSILGFICLSGLYLMKSHKNQVENNQVNPQTINPQVPNNINDRPSIPLNPNNTIMINPNIASPEGTNRLPKIIPPGNAQQMRIIPPPEVGLMKECQVLAKGNPEIMRKCFETKIQSNVMPPSATNIQSNISKQQSIFK